MSLLCRERRHPFFIKSPSVCWRYCGKILFSFLYYLILCFQLVWWNLFIYKTTKKKKISRFIWIQVPSVTLTTVRLVLSSFSIFLFYVEPENGTRLKLFLGCRDIVCMFLFKSIQQKLIFFFPASTSRDFSTE